MILGKVTISTFKSCLLGQGFVTIYPKVSLCGIDSLENNILGVC